MLLPSEIHLSQKHDTTTKISSSSQFENNIINPYHNNMIILPKNADININLLQRFPYNMLYMKKPEREIFKLKNLTDTHNLQTNTKLTLKPVMYINIYIYIYTRAPAAVSHFKTASLVLTSEMYAHRWLLKMLQREKYFFTAALP